MKNVVFLLKAIVSDNPKGTTVNQKDGKREREGRREGENKEE